MSVIAGQLQSSRRVANQLCTHGWATGDQCRRSNRTFRRRYPGSSPARWQRREKRRPARSRLRGQRVRRGCSFGRSWPGPFLSDGVGDGSRPSIDEMPRDGRSVTSSVRTVCTHAAAVAPEPVWNRPPFSMAAQCFTSHRARPPRCPLRSPRGSHGPLRQVPGLAAALLPLAQASPKSVSPERARGRIDTAPSTRNEELG